MKKLAAVTLELPPGWSSGLRSADDYNLKVMGLPATSAALSATSARAWCKHSLTACPLQVELRFGRTELSMVAFDAKTNNVVAASVAWDADIA